MRTLKNIIDSANSDKATEIEKAVLAAFSAGRSSMRGCITQQIKCRIDSLPKQRYWIQQKRTAAHIILGVDGINENYIEGRGDSGAGEAAEFLSWDFNL